MSNEYDDDFEDRPRPRRPNRPPPRRRPRREEEYDDEDDEDDDRSDGVSTIIPYKNVRALISYYLGVFSLIPCVGALLGPAALILGILGLRYAGAHPTAKGTAHAVVGLVLGTLATLGNWGVLLLILIGGGLGALR